MTVRQSPWNKYEAIILLEGFLSSLDGKISRKDAIKRISQDLREMAFCRGIEIDAIYRNENGISFQIQSMESAYHGQTMFKPATKLFAEVANIYHNSKNEYQKLLKEAQAMISKKNSVEDDFMQYLAKQVSPSPLSALYHEPLPVKRTMKKYKIFVVSSPGHFLCSHGQGIFFKGSEYAQVTLETASVQVRACW